MARKYEWSIVTVKQIEAFRRERGLTVAQFAKLLGTTATSVHNWRRGQNVPSLRTQEKIRALLDAKPEHAAPAESRRTATGAASGESLENGPRQAARRRGISRPSP